MATEILWTPLPNGRTRARLRLSVHISPRLTYPGSGEGTLLDFPALHAWPPKDLALQLQFGAAAPVPATIVSTADPTLWPLLFPTTSRVVSRKVPNYSGTQVHSYPLTKIAKFLQDQYTKIALGSPEVFPPIPTLLGNGFSDIRFSGRDGAKRWREVNQQLRGILTERKAVDTRAPSTPALDFVQLEDFFAPVANTPQEIEAVFGTVDQPKRPKEHRLDFHETVQFVNQHPALLRLLGLVVDVEVDVAAAPSGTTTVAVVPAGGVLATVANRRPRTQCAIDINGFFAVPSATAKHLADGFLRFEDTGQFVPVQVEADGGGLKAVDFAGNLGTKLLKKTEDTATESPVPSLRADGISVARLGASTELHDKFVLLASQEGDLGSDTLELHAEDLVRGYRIDVWDSATSAWNSVMKRTGSYQIAGGTPIPVTDEGFIVVSATKKPLADDLYHPEEVFAWDGWSLVAPRPGKTLNSNVAAPDPLLDRPPNNPGPDFNARFHFDHLPGSLPSLRYGTGYRFRARTVDLAGNSLPVESPDAQHATAEIKYGRFEPLQAPPVLLRTPRGPGESMETVALRSNFDVAPSPATAERHIVPGKVAQLTVEQHGALDVVHPADPAKRALDVGAYVELVNRDAATLMNHPNAAPHPGGPADTFVYDVDELSITYAPDPAVRDFAFRLIDGPHAGYLKVHPFRAAGTEWFARRAARLVLKEGSGPPAFDLASQVLTVPLEKGDLVHARLSSVLDPADLGKFGLWGWILAANPGATKLGEESALIQSGQHWMFEPFRILTLVHAVRQPLLRPEFPEGLSVGRAIGDTFANVGRLLSFSRKSTSRVDVLASWREPVDLGPGEAPPADVNDPGARSVDLQTAFTLKIRHVKDLNPTEEEFLRRHEFGDTKHRMVTYRGVATTRYGEFFTSRKVFAFAGAGSTETLDTGTPAAGVVPRSVKLVRADGVPLVEGTHFTVDPVAGTVTFGDGQQGQLPPTGESITAVYLVPPVTRETADPPTGKGEFGPQLIDVPSSARPVAPKVLYAIPTFGWEGPSESGGALTSIRRGNGLRIYLERSWWSSGEGELLGVLTWPLAETRVQPDLETPRPSPLPPLEDPRKPYVTQWGEDPIVEAGPLPARYPRLSAFPAAVVTSKGPPPLTLDELGSDATVAVNVAAHAVRYDADRDLFACDVQVNAGSAYAPFIRLALARYQPSSLPNAHLSRVVLADFLQLAPDRSATVVFNQQNPSVLTVTLAGPSHQRTEATNNQTFPGVAVVLVEKKQAGVEGPLAWAPAAPPLAMSGSVAGGKAQWVANLTLPGPRTPGTWRLVIEQYERLGTEPFKKPQSANPFLPTKPIAADRLIHADIIPL